MNPKKELLWSLRVDSSLKLERVQVLRFWVEGLRREGLIGSKGTCTTTTRGCMHMKPAWFQFLQYSTEPSFTVQ